MLPFLKWQRPSALTRIVFLTVLLFSVSQSLQAERLSVKVYTSTDGLGSSFISYLLRDSRGFMWFCTRDGLSRFDGARFLTYRIGDHNSPPGIERISETRDGSYWITTTGGLYRFRHDTLSQPDETNRNQPTLNAEFIKSDRGIVFEDRQGNLWYGGASLYQMQESDGKVEFLPSKLNLPLSPDRTFRVSAIHEANDGSLWLDTSQGLVRYLPDGRSIYYRSESSLRQNDHALLLDKEQRVWYVRNQDLFVLQPESLAALSHLESVTLRSLKASYQLPAETEKEIRLPEREGEVLSFTPADFLSRYRVHRLAKTSDDHIWITTVRELLEFDGQIFRRYTTEQGLPSAMTMVGEDAAGNLWIGGQSALVRLDRKGLTSFGEDDGFHSSAMHAIIEAKDGTLYFADGDYYLTQFDGKRFTSRQPRLLPNPQIVWMSRYAFLDSHNEWWILTAEKLYRFANDNRLQPIAIYSTAEGLKSNGAYQIYEDKKGDIWVSFQPPDPEFRGLARFDRNQNRFQIFTEADGLPRRKSVSAFVEDRNGNMWVGFYEGGIARYSDHRFTQFPSLEGIPRGFLSDLHIDRNGRLWLSTAGGGVRRIDDPGSDNPQFTSLTTADGLSSNNVRTISEDRFGNIYLGMVRGVDRISPESGQIRHYSVSDGLAGDFVLDSHCDQQGNLWFATSSGLSRLIPTADDKPHPSAIWFGGLRIAGIQQPLPELGVNEISTLELSDAQNNIQIDYFALNFHSGETVRYQYMLEGADTNWSPPTEQRSLTLANIAPGSYRFLVRAINPDGTTSSQVASFRFTILSPVWLRGWFIALSISIIGILLYGLYHYRTSRLREVNAALADAKRAEEALGLSRQERLVELERVRARIATDLHDDIGSSLTQIAILSEVAHQQTHHNGENGAAPISRIINISNELVDTMSDIVWAINPKKDHLSDLLQRMRRFASDVFTARQIDFQFRTPPQEHDIEMGASIRREVFLIFKESIHNIIKHSACTHADITFEIKEGWLILLVRDNGRGFEGAEFDSNGVVSPPGRGGNGILSMRKRAKEMGGEFEIVSRPGNGTTATLRMQIV